MKKLTKALIVTAVLFAMVLTLVPALEAPASAAATPYVSFTNLSSQNPIMDMHLNFDTFKSGGPFTVTLESKCENVQGWTNPLTGVTEASPNISIYVEGTKYASTTKQDADGISARAKLNVLPAGWQKSTFTFENVGTINVSGTDIPGNLLRTYFWQTTGTVYLRNVKIVNAAGTTVYDMNTDPDLLGLMSQMQSNGMTESDISNVASINEYCLWCAPGSFGVAGDHYGTVHIDNGTGGNTTSSSTRKPGGQTPTSSSTTKTPTSSSTTKTPTSSSTTKQPTSSSTKQPTSSSSTQPTSSSSTPVQNPCDGVGHTYVEGKCTVCGAVDPNYIPPATNPTTQPTTQPQGNGNGGGFTINPIAAIAFVLILVAGLCVIVLFATGAIGGKKKKD